MNKTITATFVALIAIAILGCQNYDDQFSEYDLKIAELTKRNNELQASIDKLKAADLSIATEVVALGSALQSAEVKINDAIVAAYTQIQLDLADLENELRELEISSDDSEYQEDLESRLESLKIALNELSEDLSELQDEVNDLNIDNVTITAWSPAFAAQTSSFSQTQTSTIADEVLNVYEREIYVYSKEPITSTVTSTVIEVGRSQVAGITSSTLNDAVVEQTSTSTTYNFHIEDADESVYDHVITSTTSWTLKD